jgi:transcriptional regulator with XRE-family HTH domain
VDAVKEIRRRKGWSQKDLAEESGVGQDTISGIESGRHEPRPSTLRKLADALDVEVADFFREPAVPLADALPPSGPLNKDEILDVVHDVILRQETETQQAANRAIWSQRMQDSYVRPENELMARLRETKRDVVDEALVETMRELVHRELAQQERERAQISEEPTAPHESTRTADS